MGRTMVDASEETALEFLRCMRREAAGRVQPGAGFDPLRGVTRLQPYLRAGPRQLKPALGGK